MDLKRLLVAVASFSLALPSSAGAISSLATTPPMGWNSWDCYGTSVTESEVKANADYMAKHLKSYGWQYVIVDIQWSEPNPLAHNYRENAQLAMDSWGRLIPAVNRFPSSAGGKGFGPLADYIHSLGLKFGIHIMRGIPRLAVKNNLPVFGNRTHAADIANTHSICPWNSDMFGVDMSKPGAQDYYNSILKMYADWGVDFIKADDIARPAQRDEITAIDKAIEKTGRPIVLSLSPGPATVKDFDFLREHANMWRISDDFWDDWKALRLNFILLGVWGGVNQSGAWPDADMLPLGRVGIRAAHGEDRMTRFTRTEQVTLMSLWSIAQSPLMFGGDLPSNDEFTNSLITNDEVLAVNQKGKHGHLFMDSGESIIWLADIPDSKAKYVAVFNVGDNKLRDIAVDWLAIGLSNTCQVHDLWAKRDLGKIHDGNTFKIVPHGSGLYRLTCSSE